VRLFQVFVKKRRRSMGKRRKGRFPSLTTLNVAGAIYRGARSIPEIAEAFGISTERVYRIRKEMREAGLPVERQSPVTREMRAERNRAIFEEAKKGKHAADMAAQFGLDARTIYGICLDMGIRIPIYKVDSTVKVSTWEAMRRLYAGDRISEIARDMEVSRQRIDNVARRMVEIGIDVRRMRREGAR